MWTVRSVRTTVVEFCRARQANLKRPLPPWCRCGVACWLPHRRASRRLVMASEGSPKLPFSSARGMRMSAAAGDTSDRPLGAALVLPAHARCGMLWKIILGCLPGSARRHYCGWHGAAFDGAGPPNCAIRNLSSSSPSSCPGLPVSSCHCYSLSLFSPVSPRSVQGVRTCPHRRLRPTPANVDQGSLDKKKPFLHVTPVLAACPSFFLSSRTVSARTSTRSSCSPFYFVFASTHRVRSRTRSPSSPPYPLLWGGSGLFPAFFTHRLRSQT